MDNPQLIFRDRRLTGFDWDKGNRAKCRSHGVSIAAIEAVFAAPFFILDDPAHSSSEPRFRVVIKDHEGRGVLVAFTLRERNGETFIRPISARYMHRKEMANYERTAQAITGPHNR
ncbi:MAG: BrnT family toxin [Stellaceae bacterium]